MSTIAVQALTKRYGTVTAVSGLSFELAPGRITGFLGPNGAGKSTTIWLLLGLAEPTSGRATINGRPYRELRDPLRQIGALAGPDVFHPGRSGRTALRIARRPPPGRRLLPGHAAAARAGRRAARRPADPDPGRARQRARPRGRALAARPAARPGRPGPHRVRLQPPARRTGPDRRRLGHHQPRPARDRRPDGRPARTHQRHLARGLLPQRDLRGHAPGRSRPGPGKEPVMRSLVSAELLKLRATRTAWIPLAAALALAVVAVLASTTAAGPDAAPHLSP